MQAFAIVHPIVEVDQTLILEFEDETEPVESRRYRLYLEKSTLEENKLIVYRPKLDMWQDITAMLSPLYLASLRNLLLQQIEMPFGREEIIS